MCDYCEPRELFLKLVLDEATANEVARAENVFDYEVWTDIGHRLRFSFKEREAIYLLRGLGDAQYSRAKAADIMRVSVQELDEIERSAKIRATQLRIAFMAKAS